MTVLPDFGAATFSDSTAIDNVYFPLPQGEITSHAGSQVDPDSGEVETERNDEFVTFETRVIEGVQVVVLRDTAYGDGILVEDTLDWFAQDDAGNVWYLGEIAVNYEYDDDGNFIGTNFDGSWEAGVDGAVAGWLMQATPTAGLESYYQEFAAGVAEDIGEVLQTDAEVSIGLGDFINVVKTLDTSALDPGIVEFKYYAPGIGQVLVEEDVNDEGVAALRVELQNIRQVDNSGAVDPADLSFAGDGSEMTVTFLTEDGSANGAIGAYTFDTATGVIGEGRILFADAEDTESGATASVMVAAGHSLGLFLIPDVDDLGLELEDYADGGLFFANFTAGNVADLFDGDPATTYTPGTATIYDGLAPLVMDADGTLLPIRPYHATGNRDGFNFLNQVAGENALESDVGDLVVGATVISFEDGLASTEGYDGDFDDAFVAVSAGPLSGADLHALIDEIGISRIVGTDENDRILGTRDDDQIIGLDGDDMLRAWLGDDVVEAGDGNDRAYGGEGDDKVFGDEGDDRVYGNDGDDEVDGGEGDDKVYGGAGDDLLLGGEGDDKLFGHEGYDTIFGGEGDDRLFAGGDGAWMSGGAGDDRSFGMAGAADTFVFDLIDFGDDRIYGFEHGTDLFEIATYTEVTSFDDIEVSAFGNGTMLAFAGGSVRVIGLDAGLVDASDFVFV